MNFQNFKIVELQQGSPEWLAVRKKKITATDVTAIMGVSPYQTARELFFDKLSKKVKPIDPDKEFIFSLGHKTEEDARKEYSLITGAEMKPVCVESTTYPLLFASLDGFYEEEGRAIEVKLVGKEAIAKAKRHDLPMYERLHNHHFIQCQTQLLVLGASEMDIFYRSPDKQSVLLTVGADHSCQQSILNAVEEFKKCLKEKVAPPLTAQDTLKADKELARKFKRLASIKKKLDLVQQSYDSLEKEIKTNPPHVRVECGGILLTQTTRAGSVEYKKIPELQGVDLEQYRGAPSVSWRLTFPKQESRA